MIPFNSEINSNDFDADKVRNEAEKKAQSKVKDIFENSLLENWLRDNQGITFARVVVTLKPVIQRMYTSEYLIQEFTKKEGHILSEMKHVQKTIGRYKAGLNFWETENKISGSTLIKLGNIIVQWLLKTGLSVIPVISLIGLLQPDIITGEKSPDFLTIIAIFSGVSLVQLTSASIYNWFISPSHEPQGLYWHHTGRSFLDETPTNEQNEKSIKKKRGKGRSLVISGLNIKPFYFFIILLWSSEAFLGFAVVKLLSHNNLSAIDKHSNPPEFNFFEIFVGVSLFALGNLFFAVARARRHNYLIKQQGKLNAVLAYEHGLNEELNYCRTQIVKESQNFDKHKKESEEILNNSETGILSEIRVLSNVAYIEEPVPIRNNQSNGKSPSE